MFDLRIDGGLVVTSAGSSVGSVGIRNGQIAAIGDLADTSARETIDATGLAVLPGAIDTHVHLGFTNEADEWTSETRAAAVGGVTCPLIYFRNQAPYDDRLRNFIADGERRAQTNFGIHLGILNDEHLRNLDRYIDDFGLRSIKMYTTYKDNSLTEFGVSGQDDGFIYDVMRHVAIRDRVCINVHCENHELTVRGSQHWVSSGDDPVAQWSAARPPLAEVEAIRRVALFARVTGARLFVPHLSSSWALETVQEERRMGGRIAVETCPQYLDPQTVREHGTLGKVNPPVRAGESGEALWQGLVSGTVTTVGTDHACWDRASKTGDVLSVRPGFPGIGTVVSFLLDGVARARMPLETFARIQESAAHQFAIRGRGSIRPGYWADLVLADLEARRTVDAAAIPGLSDFSPLEGSTLQGWPVMTFIEGRLVARDGQVVGEPQGRYVRWHEPHHT